MNYLLAFAFSVGEYFFLRWTFASQGADGPLSFTVAYAVAWIMFEFHKRDFKDELR